MAGCHHSCWPTGSMFQLYWYQRTAGILPLGTVVQNAQRRVACTTRRHMQSVAVEKATKLNLKASA
jgi:hypothetical protein